MPFIEQEASSEYKEIDGKKVHYIKPEVEITLTNKETGQEYMSDKVITSGEIPAIFIYNHTVRN